MTLSLKQLLAKIDKTADASASRKAEATSRLSAIRSAAHAPAKRAIPRAAWLIYHRQECTNCGAIHTSISKQLLVEFECARGLRWRRPTPPGCINPALPRRVLEHPTTAVDACPECFAGEGDERQLSLFGDPQ